MKKLLFVIALIILSSPVPVVYAQELSELKTKLPTDHVLGKDDATVTLIEYASLSCNHCARFHTDVLPSIKKDFVDTGKVRLIFRDFPLNAPAFFGSQVTQCAAKQGDEKYFTAIKALFEKQNDWAFAGDFKEKAFDILKVAGFEKTDLEPCMTDKDLEDRIKGSIMGGQKMGVQSTPSFFLNGEKIDIRSAEDATQTLNAMLAGKSPEEAKKEAAKEILKAHSTDLVLGQDAAPVTVIEYINIACPHCAQTHKAVLETLQKDYIDTGKVKLVFRELPMGDAGLYGYMTAHCKGKDEFFNTTSLLINDVQSWGEVSGFIAPLRMSAEKAGIPKEKFYACLEDQDVQERILKNSKEANEGLGVTRSPAIFVEGQPLNEISPDGVRKAVDEALQNKK